MAVCRWLEKLFAHRLIGLQHIKPFQTRYCLHLLATEPPPNFQKWYPCPAAALCASFLEDSTVYFITWLTIDSQIQRAILATLGKSRDLWLTKIQGAQYVGGANLQGFLQGFTRRCTRVFNQLDYLEPTGTACASYIAGRIILRMKLFATLYYRVPMQNGPTTDTQYSSTTTFAFGNKCRRYITLLRTGAIRSFSVLHNSRKTG